MADNDLNLIQRLQHSDLSRDELLDIFQQNRDKYRILLHLVMHPKFPESQSLGIISKVYLMDLLKVIKNTRTNPFVRKRSEIEFKIRFQKAALGEQVSLLRAAPASLLLQFVDETRPTLLHTLLHNPNCTEELVVRFINRPQDRSVVYQELDDTFWHSNPAVSRSIAHDSTAPIKMVIKIIPYVGKSELQRLLADATTHRSVREAIAKRLKIQKLRRPGTDEEKKE